MARPIYLDLLRVARANSRQRVRLDVLHHFSPAQWAWHDAGGFRTCIEGISGKGVQEKLVSDHSMNTISSQMTQGLEGPAQRITISRSLLLGRDDTTRSRGFPGATA